MAEHRSHFATAIVTVEQFRSVATNDWSEGSSEGSPSYRSASATQALVSELTIALVAPSVAGGGASTIADACIAATERGCGHAFARALVGAAVPPATAWLPYADVGCAEAAATTVLAVCATVATPDSSDRVHLVGTVSVGPLFTSLAANPMSEQFLVLQTPDYLEPMESVEAHALQATRPSMRDGTVVALRVVLRIAAEPMDAAFASGVKGYSTAHKHHGRALPYGSMPLDALYRHMAYFAAASRGAQEGDAAPPSIAAKKALNAAVVKRLSSGAGSCSTLLPSLHRAVGRVMPRWALLRTLDLRSAIVGDANMPPVLAVLAHCKNVEIFRADQNGLSLASAPSLFNVLSQHPSIAQVSLTLNDFFEAAGDELLRTVKVNRRISVFDMSGNAISPVLAKRFEAQLQRNVDALRDDTFNPEGSAYNAAQRGPDDLPAEAWELAGAIWRLLTVVPSSNADGHDAHKLASSGGRRSPREAPMEEFVPRGVSAPLFVAVATRAYRTLPSSSLEDPLLRQLAAPLVELDSETTGHAGAHGPNAQQVAADLARAQAVNDLFAVSSDGAVMAADVSGPLESPLDGQATSEYLYPVSFSKMFMVAYGTVLSYPHRWPYAARALKCLGHAHEQLGVPRSAYTAFNKAFFGALMHEFGPDAMHPRMQSAWLHTTALILRTVMLGRGDTLHM
jgi:hypothetical protein